MNESSPTGSWLEVVEAAFAAMTWLEAAAVAFGLAYLVLAIRQNMLCWAAALVSVLLSLVLFYEARLYSESALQVFYAVMAFYGWYQWRYGGRRVGAATDELPVSVWPLAMHVLAIGGTLAATALLGFLMDVKTDAALPYLDAFTTTAAIVTTYMVAKKLLENWVYWFVIDSLSVYMYVARGLYLYAALFVLYVVLVVVGFFRWRRDLRAQAPSGVTTDTRERISAATR